MLREPHGLATAALQLSLAFLALTPFQDHCTMLRAFKLSDLEPSIWNDFPVLFDRGEAGALRSDLMEVGEEAELGLEWVYLSLQLTTSPSLLHLRSQSQTERVQRVMRRTHGASPSVRLLSAWDWGAGRVGIRGGSFSLLHLKG